MHDKGSKFYSRWLVIVYQSDSVVSFICFGKCEMKKKGQKRQRNDVLKI
jgi:hypothetical protein